MESIIGGAILGLAASLFLLFNGRVTGVSGITSGILKSESSDRTWRLLFVIGLVAGGMIYHFSNPQVFQLISKANLYDYMFAGLLVGVGTVMGSGCTSGHGVCGISRFSIRSIVATSIFIVFGIIGLYLFKLVRGGI